MLAVLCESEKRYKQRVEQGTKEHQFQPLLVVLEEFTDWSDECNNSELFIRKACKDFRKVGIHICLLLTMTQLRLQGVLKATRKRLTKAAYKLSHLVK